MKERVIDIQARSMRENLIFYGIEERENHEAGLYSDEVLKNFFEKELEIDTSNIELDRVHRMGKQNFEMMEANCHVQLWLNFNVSSKRNRSNDPLLS